MKYIILKKTEAPKKMEVLDLVGNCEINRSKVKVGQNLLINDLLALVALGFSITFINYRKEEVPASPLRFSMK